MPTVWIPPMLRNLTAGRDTVHVSGDTLGQVIDALEKVFPGTKDHLVEAGGLRPGIAVGIDSMAGRFPLSQPVPADSEVHFLPAIGGGS